MMMRITQTMRRLRADRRGVSFLEIVSTFFILGGLVMVTNALSDQPLRPFYSSAVASFSHSVR